MRTIIAALLHEGMTVRRITRGPHDEGFDVPTLHTTGDAWPTVTRVVFREEPTAARTPYVWFTLSCCTDEAVRVDPFDEVTVED